MLPNAKDHLKNRDDYIVLVQRILVEHIPALNFLTGAVQKHIPHIYSKEMAQPTTKVYNQVLLDFIYILCTYPFADTVCNIRNIIVTYYRNLKIFTLLCNIVMR